MTQQQTLRMPVTKAQGDISQLFFFYNHVDGRYTTEESISDHSDA